LARNNTLSASFSQEAGDGATGFSESSGSLSFTSGDAIKLEASTGGSAEVEHSVATFGLAQADGIYFENRDSSDLMILSLRTATGSSNNVATFKIAPNGVFCVRLDATQTAITHVAIECGNDSPYVLCLAE
tara:strand:- start:972 stop:1364 length:393 start_codon:yes stop_codon:yes gene_type:complete